MKSKIFHCLVVCLAGGLLGCSNATLSPPTRPPAEMAGGVPATSPGEVLVPPVEIDFDSLKAGDWSGKTFREIISPSAIQRIVRTRESGLTRDRDRSQEAAEYEALFSHLLGSSAPAKDWVLADNEGPVGELVVLTRSGELFRIEIIGRFEILGVVPTGILIHGRGRGARIEVTGYSRRRPA